MHFTYFLEERPTLAFGKSILPALKNSGFFTLHMSVFLSFLTNIRKDVPCFIDHPLRHFTHDYFHHG
jgi:hypothetical protein